MANNKRSSKDFVAIIVILVFIGGLFLFVNSFKATPKKYSLDEWVEATDSKLITKIVVTPAGSDNQGLYEITGTYLDESGATREYEFIIATEADLQAIQAEAFDATNPIPYEIKKVTPNYFRTILVWVILPLFFFIFLFGFLGRALGGGRANGMDVAKSKARLGIQKTTTFDKVAGLTEEKEEVSELIEFLKAPQKFLEIGARIPKGVLLSGPPGTGKTLLAKAVAGEAHVPFYFISGSEFVEMFVGVGAARVRDMFKNAKSNSPCIIFIDEIDAVGRKRDSGFGQGNRESDQTLNQLLVEMDGFGENSGVIVIAATNRPDSLDEALLRPGRFDRQIQVSLPDVIGRGEILKVHARNKKIDPSIRLEDVALRIPGFSGAEIENLLNEAALLAARANRKVINLQDIDEGVDRVMMGPAKKSLKRSKKEINIVAHHEAGHCIVGVKLENSDIVHKVTITARGNAGGYAIMLPEEENFLQTAQALKDKIVGLLAGRVAEEEIFNEATTGAHNDFQKATYIARSMVAEYGMSKLGPIQYENNRDTSPKFTKYFSEDIARQIDEEVKAIMDECMKRCRKIIKDNLDSMKLIADYLIKIETLTKDDIYEIVDSGKLDWYDAKHSASTDSNDDDKEDLDSFNIQNEPSLV